MNALRAVVLLRGMGYGLILPIWVAHLQKQGLSLWQLGVLGTVFEIFKVVMEVPMGGVADRLGEKRALMLSALLLSATWATLGLSADMYVLAFLMLSWGLGEALFSGTFESWVSHRSGAQFTAEYARCIQIYSAASIFGALALGPLYKQAFAAPFLLAALLFVIEIGIYFRARFPVYAKEISSTPPTLLKALHNGLNEGLRVPGAARIFAVAFIAGMAYDGLDRFWQPLLNSESVQVDSFGWVFAASSLATIVLLQWVRAHESWTDSSALIRGVELVALAAVLATALLPGALKFAPLALVLALGGVRSVVLKGYLNKRLPEGPKATVFSVLTGFDAFGEVFAGLIFGALAEYFGLKVAFLGAAALLFPLIFLYPSFRRQN